MKSFAIFLLLLILCISPSAMAQEHEGEKHTDHEEAAPHGESSEHGEFKHNVLGFSIGHTHISNGLRDGDNKWLALPSFAISYTYFFNHKWGLGLDADIIVEDFVVQGSGSGNIGEHKSEEGEVAVIERGRPIAVAVIGIYKVHEHIGLLAGGGMEFSEHEDFGLVKVGAEFPFHFGNNWEVFGIMSFDFKVDAYNSFNFGFGIAKLF